MLLFSDDTACDKGELPGSFDRYVSTLDLTNLHFTLCLPAFQVVVGNLLFQALMELWVIAEITDDVVHDPRLQTAVDNIFEIVTEAMTRGMFSG